MFALAMELLAGRYVATEYNDRSVAEWPPHPARLFSALVATSADVDLRDPETSRRALEWIEQLPAPEILASGDEGVARRTVVQVFVPVNDACVVSPPDTAKLTAARARSAEAADEQALARTLKEIAKLEAKLAQDTAKAIAIPTKVTKENPGAKVLPEHRTRQQRTFPSVWPDEPQVAFVWRDAQLPVQFRAALADLLARVVRVGHSTSLVALRLIDSNALGPLSCRTALYRPDDERGSLVLRWVSAGQLTRLERGYDLHRGLEPRVLPARFVRYSPGEPAPLEAPAPSVFDASMIVFARTGGPRLPITSVAGIARQFRRALMSVAEAPVPELLSGHRPDGAPSESPHLAVVPLPFVGSGRADGAILGLALVLPRAADPATRSAVLAAVGRLEELHGEEVVPGEAGGIGLDLGAAGVLELQRALWSDDPRATLQPSRWCGPSRHWASATPVALDANPGDLHDSDPGRRTRAFAEAEESVRLSVNRIGLPDPLMVEVSRSCLMTGTAKPRSYPRFPLGAHKSPRVLVHVRLAFERLVTGPVLLGAGRYQGLGVMLPIAVAASRGIGS